MPLQEGEQNVQRAQRRTQDCSTLRENCDLPLFGSHDNNSAEDHKFGKEWTVQLNTLMILILTHELPGRCSGCCGLVQTFLVLFAAACKAGFSRCWRNRKLVGPQTSKPSYFNGSRSPNPTSRFSFECWFSFASCQLCHSVAQGNTFQFRDNSYIDLIH